MSKYTKPDYSEQWASAGTIVTPNSVKVQTGHVVEKPSYEYSNWLENRQDTGIAYSLQMGIPEWDSTTEYHYTSNSYNSLVQRNGVVYKAIQTGVNKDPLLFPAYWTIAFDDKGSAANVQTNLNNHIVNYGTLTGLTNAATARANLGVYSTSQAAQKNGDSGQLFSVANGTTGFEAVNRQQLDTKAATNGNNSQVFNVATAILAAHAIRKDQFDAKTGIATDTVAGIVEKATQAELLAGLSNVWPDSQTIASVFSYLKTTNELSFDIFNIKVKIGVFLYGELTAFPTPISAFFNTPFDNECFYALGVPYNPSATGEVSFIFTTKSWAVDRINGTLFELAGSGNQISAGIIWLAIGR